MSVVGFDTPSKIEAIKSAEQTVNSPQMKMPLGSVAQSLIDSTFNRLNILGNVIVSPEFASLPVNDKIEIMNDFAYFKSLSDSL